MDDHTFLQFQAMASAHDKSHKPLQQPVAFRRFPLVLGQPAKKQHHHPSMTVGAVQGEVVLDKTSEALLRG